MPAYHARPARWTASGQHPSISSAAISRSRPIGLPRRRRCQNRQSNRTTVETQHSLSSVTADARAAMTHCVRPWAASSDWISHSKTEARPGKGRSGPPTYRNSILPLGPLGMLANIPKQHERDVNLVADARYRQGAKDTLMALDDIQTCRAPQSGGSIGYSQSPIEADGGAVMKQDMPQRIASRRINIAHILKINGRWRIPNHRDLRIGKRR